MNSQEPMTHWSRQRYRDARRAPRIPASVVIAGGLAASAFAFFLAPQRSSEITADRVFTEGLHVQLPRTSPAYAAMEDSLLPERVPTYDSTIQASNEPMTVELLVAGQVAASWIADQITRENRRENSLLAQRRAAEQSERKRRELEARMIASAVPTVTTAPAAPVAPEPKVAVANDPTPRPVYQHPTKTISLADLQMSREELVRDLLVPLAASVDPEQAREMMVAGNQDSGTSYRDVRVLPDRRSNRDTRLAGMAPGRPDDLSRRRELPRKAGSQDLGYVKGFGIEGPGVKEQETSARREPLHQLVLAGSIEFSGGLALANTSDRVVVYREHEEQPIESAAVWIREGRYEIFVDQTIGTLVAELRTPHGDILGRGSFDLENLPPTKPSQYRVDRLNLKISPVPQGISGRVVSAYSYDQKSFPVKGARIGFSEIPLETASQTDGRFEEPSLLEGSSVIVRASRTGHWGTLAFASAGAHNTVTLYPDKMIEAFTNLTGRSAEANGRSVIWGHVAKNGVAVEGVQVELLTTEKEIRPVYFNSMMLPDASLTATSSNGLYAFFPVEPGAHAVQVSVGGTPLGDPRLFPTEAHAVSHVDLDVATSLKAQVKVFDAFRTDWPLAAELVYPGTTKGIRVDGSGAATLRYAGGSGLLIMDATAGLSYEKVRLSFNRGARSIYAPMIQSQWVDKIQAAMRINKDPHAGKVIGFIQGTVPYSIIMDEEGLRPDTRVIYFDSRGEIIAGGRGVPGGGFIIFNVPEGFHAVTVRPEGSKKAFVATVLVESTVTNILNHWIR